MSVSTHTTSIPASLPSARISSASSRASATVRMNAPSPTFTSRTTALAPEAIFFDMMLAAMSET